MILHDALAFTEITLEASFVGDDLVLLLYGGEKPHIGTVVLAQPRPSLCDKSQMSATSSILNIVGHKDEYVCRKMAEAVAAKLQTNVVCTGGIHMDDIEAGQIQAIMHAVDKLTKKLIEKLR